MLLLTFTAGANRYAVDVARIIELIPRVELRTVPQAPAFLAGLLGYRGKIVPVIDLGVLLGVGSCRDCLSTRIILVDDSPDDHHRWKQDRKESVDELQQSRIKRKPDPSLLGLVAEDVSDLIYTQPEQVVPAPIRLPHAPYLGPIVQTDHGIVQLIVVEKVRGASLQSSDLGQDTALDSSSEPSPLTA